MIRGWPQRRDRVNYNGLCPQFRRRQRSEGLACAFAVFWLLMLFSYLIGGLTLST